MEKSGFFNSSDGDRVYDATDFAAYFGSLVSNGIFYKTATNLQVSPGMGLAVSVAAGSAWINGYRYENTDALNMPLTTAHGSNPRIDRIVVRLSQISRNIQLAVVTGTPAATPVAPDLTRTSDILCTLSGRNSIAIPRGNFRRSTPGYAGTRTRRWQTICISSI
jgi:hypothetical protein